MKYKAILVDDEKKLLEVLKIKIAQCCHEINVVGTATNASDGHKLIQEHKPDIVFLDIGMPDESGFDMLRRFDSIDFEIIFVTGYDEFALQAIQFCAIGYVLKPVGNEELKAAINNAINRLQVKVHTKQFEYFFEHLQNPTAKNRRIGIPTNEGIEFVPVSHIIQCVSQGKNILVYLEDNSTIRCNYSIGQISKLLLDFGFFISHRSHLLNLKKVLKYDSEGYIIMSNGSLVPLSRRKKTGFFDAMHRLD